MTNKQEDEGNEENEWAEFQIFKKLMSTFWISYD